jgi:hypothetical protein
LLSAVNAPMKVPPIVVHEDLPAIGHHVSVELEVDAEGLRTVDGQAPQAVAVIEGRPRATVLQREVDLVVVAEAIRPFDPGSGLGGILRHQRIDVHLGKIDHRRLREAELFRLRAKGLATEGDLRRQRRGQQQAGEEDRVLLVHERCVVLGWILTRLTGRSGTADRARPS